MLHLNFEPRNGGIKGGIVAQILNPRAGVAQRGAVTAKGGGQRAETKAKAGMGEINRNMARQATRPPRPAGCQKLRHRHLPGTGGCGEASLGQTGVKGWKPGF